MDSKSVRMKVVTHHQRQDSAGLTMLIVRFYRQSLVRGSDVRYCQLLDTQKYESKTAPAGFTLRMLRI